MRHRPESQLRRRALRQSRPKLPRPNRWISQACPRSIQSRLRPTLLPSWARAFHQNCALRRFVAPGPPTPLSGTSSASRRTRGTSTIPTRCQVSDRSIARRNSFEPSLTGSSVVCGKRPMALRQHPQSKKLPINWLIHGISRHRKRARRRPSRVDPLGKSRRTKRIKLLLRCNRILQRATGATKTCFGGAPMEAHCPARLPTKGYRLWLCRSIDRYPSEA
jgi:hypothetical protein